MRRSTIIGCFVGLLSLTLSAQSTQPSSSKTTSGTSIEAQQKSTATMQELLARYANIGNQSGSISEYFSKEEQRMLHSYFSNQKAAKSNQVIKDISDKNTVKATSVASVNGKAVKKEQYIPLFLPPALKNSPTEARMVVVPPKNRAALKQQTPLFVAPAALTAEDEAEVMAAAQYRANSNMQNNVPIGNRTILSDIIPTAGMTETFTPAVGDNFFDPGGPGGSTTGGSSGNYPNCGCDTVTTLDGVTEIDFQYFSVLAVFDYLRIYDGVDATGTLLYDNGDGGSNEGDRDLAAMIASHGSSTFAGASGSLTFIFHATTIIDFGGWNVEVIAASGGSGGGGTACGQGNPSNSFENGFTSSTNQDQVMAADLIVEADTNFNLNSVVANWLVFDGEVIISADITIYNDLAGLPDPTSVIATLPGVVPTSQAIIGDFPSNSALDVLELNFDITPEMLNGQAGIPTTYWISIKATNTSTNISFWESTSASVIGNFDAFSADNGLTWGVASVGWDLVFEFSGECEAIGGGGTACGQGNPSNGFENGFTSSTNQDQVMAADLIVEADTNFNLNSVVANWLVFDGEVIISADITIYNDLAGLPDPTSVIATLPGVVPTSQAIIGDFPSNSALDVLELNFDITPEMLNGQAGIPTTYWISIKATNTSTNISFWESTSASVIGNFDAFSADNGLTWGVASVGWDLVFEFSGECEAIGGGGTACSQADASNAFENGYGNTNNSVEIADEIIVEADTDFELNQLTINMINNGGFNSIDVAIYEDAGGMPGAMVGSVMTIVPTSSTAIGVAFGRDVLEIVLDIAPGVMLNGTAGSETVYWIGVETPNPVDPASDAYWETTSIPNTGTDYRVHYDVANGGWTATLPADDMWNTVYTASGECTPMGGTGGGLTTVYGVNNANQDLIGYGITTPETVEVFGTSPITVNFENAGSIDPANPTTGYVLDNTGQFFSFDVTTGLYTNLGTISGNWVGMEFDRSSGILYAIASASLYIIDPVAVTATLVGVMGIPATNFPIALAIDGAGVGYTYEVVTDSLYSIDLATAATTLIGSIGYDANFGQGMCYDPTTDTVYMSAFNAGTFVAEWRSVDTASGLTTLIGNISDPDAQVAWCSVGETLPPPACPKPINLVVTNIAPTSVDLSWDAEPNASSGYIWYVFDAGADISIATPVATGSTPSGTTTASATGLSSGFSYDFYVVADCNADGLSQYAGPITFATPPTCGDKFYDTGGPGGNYQNDENLTTVISPVNTGDQVTVTFTAFDVESEFDALYVYDGPDATAPLISSGNPATTSGFPAGGYYGVTNPGPFTSSHASGTLTFIFMSDGSISKAGWEADITCAPTPPPNDMIVNSIDVDEVGFPYTDTQVNMPAATTENGSPAGCDLTGANGVWYNFVPFQDGTATAMIVTPGGASSVTFYTAPNESSIETDLTLVPQQSNQCAPGTSASIVTLGGQAYYVFVLNTGAVTDIKIDGIGLGISDNTIAGFNYYPNPTNGVLNLNSIENIENVSIYNMLGQLVIGDRINATATQVDISGLNTGTYLMKVTVNGQMETYRVLKQ